LVDRRQARQGLAVKELATKVASLRHFKSLQITLSTPEIQIIFTKINNQY
jgi:hypothetical protein